MGNVHKQHVHESLSGVDVVKNINPPCPNPWPGWLD